MKRKSCPLSINDQVGIGFSEFGNGFWRVYIPHAHFCLDRKVYTGKAFQDQPTFRGLHSPTTNHISSTFLSPQQEANTCSLWRPLVHLQARQKMKWFCPRHFPTLCLLHFPPWSLIGISPEKTPSCKHHPPPVYLYLPSSFHFLFRSNSQSFSSPQSSMVYKLQRRQSDSHVQRFLFSKPGTHILVL